MPEEDSSSEEEFDENELDAEIADELEELEEIQEDENLVEED